MSYTPDDGFCYVLQIKSSVGVNLFSQVSLFKVHKLCDSGALSSTALHSHPAKDRSVIVSGQCVSHVHELAALFAIKINLLHAGISPPISKMNQKLEKEREKNLYKLLRNVD